MVIDYPTALLEDKAIMEQYKSRWGENPQTIEEHINMIMGRYIETKDIFQCFTPKIGIVPYEACLENVLKVKDWDRLNNFTINEQI